MVWANENNLVLGQVKVSEKSNEITAIPKLLEVLSLENTIVTIDAMGCQTDIAEKIINKQANYILAVKGNQEQLYQNIKDEFRFGKNIETLLKNEKTSKIGIKSRRMKAGWDNHYLIKVLNLMKV